ncbi:MAG: hypothetical protein KQ78_02190 [Candidatus Izimaplasma bacterium HR2]|nr:MAG: hypothetical protein KQ78_02190 [Candidatus Izimaplasma bacterium HR2]
MSVKCKISGHAFEPYRYRWVEFMPSKNTVNINRDGAYTLSHVYCKRCGLVKEVTTTDGKYVKYRDLS